MMFLATIRAAWGELNPTAKAAIAGAAFMLIGLSIIFAGSWIAAGRRSAAVLEHAKTLEAERDRYQAEANKASREADKLAQERNKLEENLNETTKQFEATRRELEAARRDLENARDRYANARRLSDRELADLRSKLANANR